MRSASFLSAALALSIATAGLVAQQLPRFRAGANLVRVDAYVTADGKPVSDLTVDDFEVLEDGVAQKVESFQLIQPRGPAPVSALREPNTVAESRQMASDPAARLFVIFMDIWHVQIEGSYHAKAPIMAMLGRVIALLCRAYSSLAPERIVGHSDVAPGRKTDPGLAFDWPRLHALVLFELDLMAGVPS